ncbi:MAG: terpene cyclase/mutase family protein [Aureliella sp.]
MTDSRSPNAGTHLSRRVVVSGAASLLLPALSPATCRADAFEPRRDLDAVFTEKVDNSVRRGLDLLLTRQKPDGTFSTDTHGKWAGVCALGGMALLSRGVRPGLGTAGEALSRTRDYVLSCVQSNGFVSSEQTSHGPMYGHGFGTLFLAEVYGQDHHADLRAKLQLAVRLIIRSQNASGGWRYNPSPSDADLSVTACQMMALRAARNAGIEVPKKTIDAAVGYIRRSQNPDGGFMYQVTGGSSRFPLTAAAVVALYSAGIYEGDEIRLAIDYIRRRANENLKPGRDKFFFYAHYYSSQVFWHLGGTEWTQWYNGLKKALLPAQNAQGGWFDFNSTEYATAMACLILSMPRTLLPIFQR